MLLTKLGINIDHCATIRQARKESFPDPLEFAQAAVRAGADGITAHLREDRRHIQDLDIIALKKSLSVPLNLEMSITPEIVQFAIQVKPQWTCLVPENRQELTTEGGLNLLKNEKRVADVIERLHGAGVKVSVFIDPDEKMIKRAKTLRADAIEIHTGPYAAAWTVQSANDDACSGSQLAIRNSVDYETKKILSAARAGREEGLLVNAGHGLDYDNVRPLAHQFGFNEFNIGFAVVAKSLFVGIAKAVKDMKNTMRESSCAES